MVLLSKFYFFDDTVQEDACNVMTSHWCSLFHLIILAKYLTFITVRQKLPSLTRYVLYCYSYFKSRLSLIVRVNVVLAQGLLLTVTDVSITCALVIFSVKVSCITSVDGIILWLLT